MPCTCVDAHTADVAASVCAVCVLTDRPRQQPLSAAEACGRPPDNTRRCVQLGEGTSIQSGLFLQESRMVVTRHTAASIGVWHVASGALIAFFACDDPVEHLACTPRGVLALGTQSGAMHFIQLPVRSAPRSFAANPPGTPGNPPPPPLHLHRASAVFSSACVSGARHL